MTDRAKGLAESAAAALEARVAELAGLTALDAPTGDAEALRGARRAAAAGDAPPERRRGGRQRNLGGAHPRPTLTVRHLHVRPPMQRTAVAAAEATRIAALLGLELGEGSARGASDGNFLAGLGIPVLDRLGPGGGDAHAAGEHVRLDSIEQRGALLALLVALL